jgi:hypothetical protein
MVQRYRAARYLRHVAVCIPWLDIFTAKHCQRRYRPDPPAAACMRACACVRPHLVQCKMDACVPAHHCRLQEMAACLNLTESSTLDKLAVQKFHSSGSTGRRCCCQRCLMPWKLEMVGSSRATADMCSTIPGRLERAHSHSLPDHMHKAIPSRMMRLGAWFVPHSGQLCLNCRGLQVHTASF